jgi:fermentation-respiration switch protein FrsA (DUF1100 family)
MKTTLHTLFLWMTIISTLSMMNCRFLVNRFAFFPDQKDLIPPAQLPAGVEEVFIQSSDGERLQCYWLPDSTSKRVLIYFHGNAGNIGHRLPDLQTLQAMGLNVLGLGYRGYGGSSGRPSEAGIYADGRAALDHVIHRQGFSEKDIILLGRSIGSTVAVETAKDRPLAAVILVSPMTSGRAVGRAAGFGPMAALAGNAFDNESKIHRIRSPLLIVHGTNDDVIPFSMGRQLFETAPEPKHFAPVDRAGHNDLSLMPASVYGKAVRRLIDTLPD